MKLSIIGAGRTGCACGYVCGMKSIFNEIVLIDKVENKAIGKALDLEQGFIMLGKNISVKGSYDYNDIKNSDVIVITASVPHPTLDTAEEFGMGVREMMARDNKKIMDEIISKLKPIIKTDETQPLIIVLTNPMDVILSYFMKNGNFNKKKTIGSGNWLDTARFKYYLAKEFNVPASEIETYCVAQHGDKIVCLMSQTRISGIPLLEYVKQHNISDTTLKEIEKNAIFGGTKIIELITDDDSTTYGPGISLYVLADAYIRDKKQRLVASVFCNGEYGVNDFALGVPIILGKNGVEKILELPMSKEDEEKYKASYEYAKMIDEK